jgi:hypothetical protein
MDWADRKAAEIVQIAFKASNARDQIASQIRLIHLNGQKLGLEAARQILNDSMSPTPPTTDEVVARIHNACRQV